jgi:hypothetical protein
MYTFVCPITLTSTATIIILWGSLHLTFAAIFILEFSVLNMPQTIYEPHHSECCIYVCMYVCMYIYVCMYVMYKG